MFVSGSAPHLLFWEKSHFAIIPLITKSKQKGSKPLCGRAHSSRLLFCLVYWGTVLHLLSNTGQVNAILQKAFLTTGGEGLFCHPLGSWFFVRDFYWMCTVCQPRLVFCPLLTYSAKSLFGRGVSFQFCPQNSSMGGSQDLWESHSFNPRLDLLDPNSCG